MRALLALLALAFAGAAFGQASEIARPDPAVEKRLRDLGEELRCLVCQNQTIADSNAPLALDLRNQIRTQIAQGRSDSQIRDYMVERYGDFVLYRPPFKASTAVLWIAPPALLLVGAFVLFGIVRRKKGADVVAPGTPDPVAHARMAAMLEGHEPAMPSPAGNEPASGPARTRKGGKKS
jgi:cytochrome c-type biogenesis protein CcmH